MEMDRQSLTGHLVKNLDRVQKLGVIRDHAQEAVSPTCIEVFCSCSVNFHPVESRG